MSDRKRKKSSGTIASWGIIAAWVEDDVFTSREVRLFAKNGAMYVAVSDGVLSAEEPVASPEDVNVAVMQAMGRLTVR